jgi:hypothetical protein
MEVLLLGPVRGNLERFLGLIEVSNPDMVVSLGTHGFEQPVKIPQKWFYSRGKGDRIEVLSRSSGIDFMSRIFKTKEGVVFSGVSGVYNPSTSKFTRSEWIKIKGKIGRSKTNSIFKEDVENLIALFLKSGEKRLNFLVVSDAPDKPVFKEILEVTKPEYVFYPSNVYRKERVGNSTFIGLEPIESPSGKYILRF